MTTRKEIDHLVSVINSRTLSPAEYSDKTGICVGHFYANNAPCYGGYCLHRVCNSSGGVYTPLGDMRYPAKAFAAMLRAFIRGLDFDKNA